MNDDELLLQLQAALAPDPTVRPPATALIAMHRAIDAATFPVRLGPTPRPRPRLFSIVVAACGVAAVTLGLLATTTSFSRAVREAAHDVGLPVDSPDLVDARARRDELGAAVERRDLVATAATLARLRTALTRLDDDELASLQPGVDELIERAEAVLAPPPSTTSTHLDHLDHRGGDHRADRRRGASAARQDDDRHVAAPRRHADRFDDRDRRPQRAWRWRVARRSGSGRPGRGRRRWRWARPRRRWRLTRRPGRRRWRLGQTTAASAAAARAAAATWASGSGERPERQRRAAAAAAAAVASGSGSGGSGSGSGDDGGGHGG